MHQQLWWAEGGTWLEELPLYLALVLQQRWSPHTGNAGRGWWPRHSLQLVAAAWWYAPKQGAKVQASTQCIHCALDRLHGCLWRLFWGGGR